MEMGNGRSEGILRVCAILSLILTALLVGFDNQTREIFHVKKKASFRSLNALSLMVYVNSIAAGYNLLQLCKCWFLTWPKGTSKRRRSTIFLFWVCFMLDQIAVYMTFAANLAGLEGSLLSVTGAHEFQWMKLCNKYKRFCTQIGGSLMCGFVASFLMAVISFISAFNLFSHYSPKHFLLLKPT